MFGLGKNEQSKPDVVKLADGAHDTQAMSEIILNSIEDGVVLIDENKVIQVFNPGAEAITGWKKADAKGLEYYSVFQFVNAKNEPYLPEDDPFSKAFSSGDIVRDGSANLALANGAKTTAVSISINPLKDSKGNITALVGVFMDVTKERVAESQRAEFISTASHEMRTPVAAIEGYLALAMNEKVCHIDTKARDYINKAHINTQQLGKLFQDLLTSAKAEDGRLVNHPQPIDMGKYLEQLAEGMRFTAEKKGLLLEYRVGTNDDSAIDATRGQHQIRPLYYVNVDPDRIREVLTNLFDNAIKYTDAGKITIGIAGDNQVVQIHVKDSGQGIPKDDIPHLFEKFYRVDNSATRSIGGTGLGLFICRKIVEIYNGRIWVESELGKGSAFYINLPRISVDQATQIQAQQASQISPLS